MNYYCSTDGKGVQGPYSADDLARLYSTGELSSTTRVRVGNVESWHPISSFIHPRLPSSPPPLPTQGDTTGGFIPYKNPHALTAYYLGVFGIIPAIGLLLAIPALILGLWGLKKRKLNPAIKGAVHAWIGILLGTLSVAYHIAVLIVIVMK